MKRSELRSDPETARAWQQRSRDRQIERASGREGMLSSFLRAATAPGDFRDDDGHLIPSASGTLGLGALKRSGRKAQIKVPPGERAKALRRSDGLCVVCLHDLRAAGKPAGLASPATHLHHVLPKRSYPEHAKLGLVCVGICVPHHEQHELAFRRIPRAALHQGVIDFASEHGIDWYLERTYPA